jgi:hypothetical protein
MHSPSFPPTDPQSDASLPSTWSGRVPCPRFGGTIKALRLPAVPPAALRCLRLAVPRGAPGASLPRTQARVPWTWSSLVRQPLTPPWPVETVRISQVPGKPPLPIRPCSSTPAGLAAPHRGGAAVRPPQGEQRGLLHWDFRGSIAWLLGSLSTLRRVGCPTAAQDSLPGAG